MKKKPQSRKHTLLTFDTNDHLYLYILQRLYMFRYEYVKTKSCRHMKEVRTITDFINVLQFQSTEILLSITIA